MPNELPDYQTLMLPVLKHAAEGDTTVPDVIERVAADMGLSQEQLGQLLPSGKQTTIGNRAHWARFYLIKAGLLEQVRRGVFRASERGRNVLTKNPTRIDNKFLSQFPEFRDFLQNRAEEDQKSAEATQITSKDLALETLTAPNPPDERIDKAVAEIEANLRDELLTRIFSIEPTSRRALFFERLVLRLLVAMGYGIGLSDAASHLGGRGDGGVDGVIQLDALGLDRVYVQAKCYDRDVAIQPSQVRDFSGSLDDKKTTRGVFITTARFSNAALSYVAGIQKQIVLIDGEELARLMVRFGIGARVDRTIEIKRLDEDAFEE
jgi:restriction system protein